MTGGSGGTRTLSISRSKREWSADCLPSRKHLRPGPSTQGGSRTHRRPGLSRAARPLAYLGLARRKPWDSNPRAARGRHLFSRQAPHPAGWLPCAIGPKFRGLGIEPAASAFRARRHDQQQLPRIREGGFEPPPPDSMSASLPVSRFPRAPRGSRTRLSDLGSPRLTARPGTHHTSLRVRDRGVEPRSPGWKPGVVPLDQSSDLQAEGEGVEPSRLIARPVSNRVPSPIGLPFRIVQLRRQESNLRPPG